MTLPLKPSCVDAPQEDIIIPSQAVGLRRQRVNMLAKAGSKAATMGIVGLAPLLLIMLLARSWSLLATRPVFDLLLSANWSPSEGEFGFFAFLISSLWVTVLALLISVPISILGASYLSEYSQSSMRKWIKSMVELLAGIPSVVYGLWGVLVIVPVVRQLAVLVGAANTTGYSIFSASLVLSVMVMPFLLSLTEEMFSAVPRGAREAALALGATRWETTRDVVWRQTKSGIFAVVVLSFGRAFGETLAVLMVVGNMAKIPSSPFDAGYPLPALIANNFGEMMSVPLYDAALMTAALVLLLVVVLFNVGARVILWGLASQNV